MRLVIYIALAVIVVVALVMIARPSGPRVTRIEHRPADDDKDGEDA